MKSSAVSDTTSVFHGRHNCSHLECRTGKQGGRGRMSPSRGSRKRALQGWGSQGREDSCTHSPSHGSHQHAQPCPLPRAHLCSPVHTHTHTCSLLPQTQTSVHKHSCPHVHSAPRPHSQAHRHLCLPAFGAMLRNVVSGCCTQKLHTGKGAGAVPSQ